MQSAAEVLSLYPSAALCTSAYLCVSQYLSQIEGNPLLPVAVDQLPVVADRGWNALANAGPVPAILIWWLAFSLIGWVAWPLLWRTCRGLPDRGYLLAKALGWLLLGYGLWLGASVHLVANRVPTVYAGLGLLLLAGGWLACKQRRLLLPLLQARRRLLLFEEALFSTAFLALVGTRLLNPDLWQPWFGGEKMMEMAFLNAITKSASFPPYDPYFAGGQINYYYYGLYLVNVLIKLTGIVPEVAFNLASPTFFALAVGLAFSFGHALTARCKGRCWLWGGMAAAVGVGLLGNLTVLVQWLGGLVTLGGGVASAESGFELSHLAAGIVRWLSGQAAMPAFDYWYQATRIIPYTINEFPFFSYLFADLHPHMMSLPFTIAVLLLCVSFVVRGPLSVVSSPWSVACGLWPVVRGDMTEHVQGTTDHGQRTTGNKQRTMDRWSPVLLALTVGALGPLNTWDLPTYLGLTVLIVGWAEWRSGGGRRGLLRVLAVGVLAIGLYLPFYAHYTAPALHLVWEPAHTGLRYFAVVWGLWVVALYGWLLSRAWRGRDGFGRLARVAWLAWRQSSLPSRGAKNALWLGSFPPLPGMALTSVSSPLGRRESRPTVLAIVRWALGLGTLLLVAVALLSDKWVVALLLPLLVLSLDLVLRPRAQPVERLAGLLAATGLAILVGCELGYLADFLQGSEWRRMNTVFKFGMQAWVLLALALAVGLPAVLDWLRAPGRRAHRLGWMAAMVGLLSISLAYVPLGTVARVTERFPGGPPPVGTLDGLAFMRTGVYHWPEPTDSIILHYDLEAIRWLQENVQGTPVLAEAPIGYYREGGLRVSSYTGLPTLCGMHQVEQRAPEQVYARQALAEELYRTTDPERILALMRELDVCYVYVGQLEEIVYGTEVQARFQALAEQGLLEMVYSNPRVTIYRLEDGDG